MSMKLFSKINDYALKQVEGLKPDINSFIIGADDETYYKLYINNDTFIQAVLYDKTTQDRIKIEVYLTIENWEVLKQQINNYNDELKQAQIKAIETAKLIEEYVDEKTYLYFNRVNDDLGIIIYRESIRNKEREKIEEKKRFEEHNHLMKTDAEYRREYNWHNAEDRPFGGAFSSWDDYYNYRK